MEEVWHFQCRAGAHVVGRRPDVAAIVLYVIFPLSGIKKAQDWSDNIADTSTFQIDSSSEN